LPTTEEDKTVKEKYNKLKLHGKELNEFLGSRRKNAELIGVN